MNPSIPPAPRSPGTSGRGPSRRALLGTGAAATVALAGLQGTADAATPLRAAVLEHLDQWTNGVGLAVLLRRAGFTVVPLDTTKPATEQGVDLIAFGSFTNNAPAYGAFLSTQAASLAQFVFDGGVALDLAQSDQIDTRAAYLPAPLEATRNDADSDTIFPTAPDHPLVSHLRVVDGRVLTGRSTQIRVSWESLVGWSRMQVLLACSTSGRPPALLEGAHGDGRYLVSSLTIDKCYRADEKATIQPTAAVADSEAFFTGLAAYVRSVQLGQAPEVRPTLRPMAGPLVGDTGTDFSRVLFRPGDDLQDRKRWTLTYWRPTAAGRVQTVTARISEENDGTVLFALDDLRPDTRYTYAITPVGIPVPGLDLGGSFTTATPDNRPTKLVMGMGSCVWTEDNAIWDRIITEGCESFVMLGDTPYIDSTNLVTARQKQRAFLEHPHVNALTRSMPSWATWDDHDFGGNDVHGDLAGKRNTRTAFVDYRANSTYGHSSDGRPMRRRTSDGEGIYTSFRRGPIEVFLLDPRWFSRTETSWADPTKTTGIGQVQWEWLQRALSRSTAPFKCLATGMIWDDKQNGESDDWGTYAHERDAILSFVARERIPGVFLVGGDIHVSRALKYDVARTGYDLWQFIVSPMHSSTIPSLNVPNPALVHSAVEPHVFLRLEIDTTVRPHTLKASWINRAGDRVFEVTTDSERLTPRAAWVGFEPAVPEPELPLGREGTLTTSFTNNDERALRNVVVSLQAPAGWTVVDRSPAEFRTVARGATVTTTWGVVPPVGTPTGSQPLRVVGRYAGERDPLTADGTVQVLPAPAVPAAQLSIAGVSSEQGPAETAVKVLDGDPATFWHTAWRTAPAPRYPHWVALALGGRYAASGLRYLPRQDGPNTRIKDYEISVSEDGTTWGAPVATGSFADGTAASVVTFPGTAGRFVRLTGLTSQTGAQWGGAAGITVFGERA